MHHLSFHGISGIGFSYARDPRISIDLYPGPIRPKRSIFPRLPVNRLNACDLHWRRSRGKRRVGSCQRSSQHSRNKGSSANGHSGIIVTGASRDSSLLAKSHPCCLTLPTVSSETINSLTWHDRENDAGIHRSGL